MAAGDRRRPGRAGAARLRRAARRATCVGARGMPVVVAHGWVALASLADPARVRAVARVRLRRRAAHRARSALALHVVFAAYGFMGMLALGLSYILVPMFALRGDTARAARADLVRAGRARAGCSRARVALGSGAAAAARRRAARGSGVAVALHLRLMAVALDDRHAPRTRPLVPLVRIAWTLLPLEPAAPRWRRARRAGRGLATLFGSLLIGGWLLTFLVGILQRIVPFLASMHAVARPERPPRTPSSADRDAAAGDPLLVPPGRAGAAGAGDRRRQRAIAALARRDRQPSARSPSASSSSSCCGDAGIRLPARGAATDPVA